MILKNCAISEGSDIVRKLIAAHENMSDGMRMIAERRQTHIHQDLPQGVRPTDLLMRELNKTRTRDMDVLDPILYELKVVFESPNSDGECGVREHEFLSTFGPVFMPGGSPEDLAQWFNNIDYDANGLVEWNEFCSFIMSSRYLDLDSNSEPVFSTTAVPFEDFHRDSITKILHNTTSNAYYTSSTDGTVRLWNPTALSQPGRVIHSCVGMGTYITDMKWISELNKLIVLQSDRAISVYDCACFGRTRRNPLLKVLKGTDSSCRRRSQRPIAYRLVETNAGENSFRGKSPQGVFAKLTGEKSDGRKLHKSSRKKQQTEMNNYELHAVEAVPLFDLKPPTLTVDYSSFVGGGSYFIGSGNGCINLYNGKGNEDRVQDGHVSVVHKWKPHSDWITKVQVVQSLDSVVSSSTDESIKILNLEKGQTYVTMKDTNTIKTVNGFGKRCNKGVFGFDYNAELNLLASWGENRRFLIWNPLTATCLFSKMDHGSSITEVLFKSNHQFLSVSEDKTIQIWDIRTFKCVQTIVDKHSNSEDHYRAICWDEPRKTIISGVNHPVLYRTRASQDRIDSGLSSVGDISTDSGHTKPIITVLYNPKFWHILTIDREKINAWDMSTGEKIVSWLPVDSEGRGITAACLGTGNRRLIIAVDNGFLYSLNYMKRIVIDTINTAARDEFTMVFSFIANEGKLFSELYIAAAGLGKKILLYCEEKKNRQRLKHSLPLENNGVATTMAFTSPCRLIVGTSKGFLLLYNLNNMTLMSVCNQTSRSDNYVGVQLLRQAVTAATGTSALRAGPNVREKRVLSEQRMIHNGSSTSMLARQNQQCEKQSTVKIDVNPNPVASDSKLSKLSQALSKTSAIAGATSFIAFQNLTQKYVSEMIESLIYLTPLLLATLHGNGDLSIWKISKETHQSFIVECIPVSHRAGEAAKALYYNSQKEILYTGDDEGFLSAFYMAESVVSLSMEIIKKDDRKSRGRLGKGMSAPPAVNPRALRTEKTKLVLCIKAHTNAVNSITVVEQSDELIVTAGNDWYCRVWSSVGLHIATFGSTEWPRFLSSKQSTEIKSDYVNIDSEGKNNQPDTRNCIRTHYFAIRFPHLVKPCDGVSLGEVIRNNSKSNNQIATTSSKPNNDTPSVQLTIPDSEIEPEVPRNVDRMISYTMRKTRDPSLRRALEMQRLEPDCIPHKDMEGTINLALDKVREYQRYKNPSASQYATLRLPPPRSLKNKGKRDPLSILNSPAIASIPSLLPLEPSSYK